MIGSTSKKSEVLISDLKKLPQFKAKLAPEEPPFDFPLERLIKSGACGLLLITAFMLSFKTGTVSAQENITPTPTPSVLDIQPIKTLSQFTKKQIQNVINLPKGTTYKDDPDLEAGIENIIDPGEDGKEIDTIEISYYMGVEMGRETVKVDKTLPQDTVIQRGTKIVWKTLDTPDGQITYWKKMRVYATQYDSHCPGCDDWTAIGMHQGKGVIAVDPSVIKMRSKIYVPGYGLSVAGDTGGDIKGNRIDVGFDDARTSGWYSHYIDIYLM